uniref:Uncharacterized protein n=1 Tax=Avena sativa TaxID=4498 RepID=A0ACD5XH40_AVESA
MDLAPSLPDDLLADVLHRLAARGLAASRCVCKSWRRVVDGRRLLRADLLPLSLGGIFLNYHDLNFTQFLNRPTTGTAVSGRLDYTCHASEPGRYSLPRPYAYGHCNGLLLFDHCVVNPATQQWALLPSPPDEMPQPPPPGMYFRRKQYLVFDPTLSPNSFELLILPDVPSKLNNNDECEEFEWPPSMLILPVFSSKTGSWEEVPFCREGEAAGTLPGMVGSSRISNGRLSAYWQGALYICYSDCFVLRISLSDKKYQVITLPPDVCAYNREFYMGKSVKGIYCASLLPPSPYHAGAAKLQVWFLSSPTEWVLKHDSDIFHILPYLSFDKHCNRPWILQEFDYWYEYDASQVSDEEDAMADSNEALVEEAKFDWDSDNDDVLEPGSKNEASYMYILGFHPYKEVVLFSLWERVLAYHWASSKIQHLGKLFPNFYLKRRIDFHHTIATDSFPYTPCWLGELPEKLNLS